MTEETTCPECERSIAVENAPFHALGHRVDKVSQGLKQMGEQVGKLPDTLAEAVKGLPTDPKVAAELMAVKEVLGKLISGVEAIDTTSTPEQVEAHIKECPTCRQRWEPYLTKPEPKPEPAPAPAAAPVAPPTPAAPKRLSWPTEADVPGSALSQGAYKVERHPGEGGVGLRVHTEEEGKEATKAGVVPRCRWVKGEDGYHYACQGE